MREKTIEERFWSKVKKTNKCFYWTAYKFNGYGRLNVNGKNTPAHRFSYELNKGKIPSGMCVCHSCDNPLCVNPEHLWLGTRKDNNLDRTSKGRSVVGEQRSQSKLSWGMVNDIRKIYSEGKYSQRELCKKFNISQPLLCKVVNNKNWVK